MTLSDLEGHSTIIILSVVIFRTVVEKLKVDEISTASASRGLCV